jgi:hypothetical protein
VQPARSVAARIPDVGAVTLRYTATAPILVVGPATGRKYRFSSAEPVQSVARADARRMLATMLFTL